MTRRRLLLALLVLSSPAAGFADGLTLAKNGTARLPIVVSSRASERTKAAAQEWAGYLKRIASAEFRVEPGDGSRGIVLGTIDEFPDDDLAKHLEIRNGRDGVEAFCIRTEKDRLRLIGATDLGTSHAAFRLLEEIGCRWFFPAPEWEVIPKLDEVNVSLDLDDRPTIQSRRIWYGYGFFDRRRGQCQRDYEAWSRHNRMAQSRKIWCGHAWQSIIRANQKVFDAHPDYLALVKGQRRGPQFCVSNPAVRKIAIDWALGQLRRRPELDMVSMETSDGSNHCECDNCAKLGSIPDRVFGLANDVGKAVAREFPGKMVGMYAYNDHCEPPSFPLEPNVYVQSTAGFIRGRYTFDELMTLWPKVAQNFGFYEYFSVWLWDFDMPARGRGGNVAHITEQIRKYASLGATSIDCESGDNWGPHGRGYYVATHLMWNPDRDVEPLLADFYSKAFGPAASVMRSYYERLDPGNDPLWSSHLLALALRDLEEAAKLASKRPDVLARLAHLKQYLHYVRLRHEYDNTRDKDRRKELTLAALTHVYRTRYSYMNHWEAIRQSWTRKAADDFAEPAWAFNSPEGPKPWMVDEPLSLDETERLFRQDLAAIRPDPVEEVEFSPALVPSRLKGSRPPAGTRQRFQRGARYAFYSRAGEPLEFRLTTGVIAWYRDRAEARFEVTDAKGKLIVSGRLPQDGQAHAQTVKVPAAGLYFLDFNDQAAGWGIDVEAGRPVSLVLNRARYPLHMGHMQRMYFYVPRGTTQLHYYWKGGPHTLHLPNGAIAAEITSSGSFVRVNIPKGADGQAWSISKLALGHLWLFNAPNQLAASRESLLIPEDL